MGRPPRDPQEAILSRRFFAAVVGYGLVITASTLVAFGWGLVNAPASASTMAFMTLALAQIGHLGNARSNAPVLRLDRIVANPYALVGVACALVLQAAAAFIEPLAQVLRVVPLHPREWLVVVACASVAAIGGQGLKLLRPGGAAPPDSLGARITQFAE
jgi:Ca2+-transporting ATPase